MFPMEMHYQGRDAFETRRTKSTFDPVLRHVHGEVMRDAVADSSVSGVALHAPRDGCALGVVDVYTGLIAGDDPALQKAARRSFNNLPFCRRVRKQGSLRRSGVFSSDHLISEAGLVRYRERRRRTGSYGVSPESYRS